jgi:UDP-N-acetylglucosamine 2-epimerase
VEQPSDSTTKSLNVNDKCEEAPSFGKPVLVTRETTERPEAMELGLAALVGTDEERLFSEMTALLDDSGAYSRMSGIANPYGDGHASRRIAQQLMAETGMPCADAAG